MFLAQRPRGKLIVTAARRLGDSFQAYGSSNVLYPDGLTKRSANRSLVPRFPAFSAAGGEAFQSRASAGLRRDSLSDSRRKPALCTSSLTTLSSIRCNVFVSASPAHSSDSFTVSNSAPPVPTA